ncbi:MAG: seg [Candidatus Paceibacter sp.]|jgi:hypothetical protein|nr:seg [Candidatus Paceibacter sp.]
MKIEDFPILVKIKSEIIVPLIALLFVLAFIYFLWGVVQYIMHMNSPGDRQTGQRHMVWGIIGIAIMISAFGIVNFVFNSVTRPEGTPIYGIDGQPITQPDILKPGNQGF